MSHTGSDTSRPVIGIVVGLAAEARIARRAGWPVAVGGGTPAGAADAARRLLAGHATVLLSFGLAGGLDPRLRPGDVIVPDAVVTGDRRLATDPLVNTWMGGATAGAILGADAVAATIDAKQRAWRESGCVAVDLETGAMARVAEEAGVPFAALRAICDPADRPLPPAALAALDSQGVIGLGRVLASVLRAPGQIPALLALASDAMKARQALRARIDRLRQGGL